ncbi:MAG: hypothetical protein ABSG43_13595 [Solirubrobacteraceae bacterium]|jgi:hypothetical protein
MISANPFESAPKVAPDPRRPAGGFASVVRIFSEDDLRLLVAFHVLGRELQERHADLLRRRLNERRR